MDMLRKNLEGYIVYSYDKPIEKIVRHAIYSMNLIKLQDLTILEKITQFYKLINEYIHDDFKIEVEHARLDFKKKYYKLLNIIPIDKEDWTDLDVLFTECIIYEVMSRIIKNITKNEKF